MDGLSNGFVDGDFSQQFGIPRMPVLVEPDRPAIRMHCRVVYLGMGVALPKYSCTGSSHRVSGQGCVPVQLFEVRGVARRSDFEYKWTLGYRNRRGQSLR